MKKLYVGCSLTQAPEDFKTNIENVKNQLCENFEVLDFVGLTAGTEKDVYNWDIRECVAKCDIFVAICDLPAIGLGYELAVAVEHLGKPTLALAHTDAKVTRLVLGIDKPNYQCMRYGSTQDIPGLVKRFSTRV